MKKLLFIIPAVFLVTFLFEGCAPTKATLKSNVNPDISNLKISNIAVMPFSGIKIDTLNLGEIDTTIIDALGKKKLKIGVAGSFKTNFGLTASTLNDWNSFFEKYTNGKDVDASLTSQIGKEFKADAIIQGEVSNVVQRNAVYGDKYGDTKITLKINMFAAETGKLLWSATSDGTVGTLTTADPAPPVIDAVVVAVKKIFLNFPMQPPAPNRNVN